MGAKVNTITVNWGSIKKKFKRELDSMGLDEKNANHIMAIAYDGVGRIRTEHSPQEAGEKFVEVLSRNIEGSGVSAGVKCAVDNWEVGTPETSDNIHFNVPIIFTGELQRPSLEPTRFGDGINNIVLLYDQGVGHTMNRVYGKWHGKKVGSRTVIPKAHYIESAIEDFMVGYADQYGVVDIEYTGTYSGTNYEESHEEFDEGVYWE